MITTIRIALILFTLFLVHHSNGVTWKGIEDQKSLAECLKAKKKLIKRQEEELEKRKEIEIATNNGITEISHVRKKVLELNGNNEERLLGGKEYNADDIESKWRQFWRGCFSYSRDADDLTKMILQVEDYKFHFHQYLAYNVLNNRNYLKQFLTLLNTRKDQGVNVNDVMNSRMMLYDLKIQRFSIIESLVYIAGGPWLGLKLDLHKFIVDMLYFQPGAVLEIAKIADKLYHTQVRHWVKKDSYEKIIEITHDILKKENFKNNSCTDFDLNLIYK